MSPNKHAMGFLVAMLFTVTACWHVDVRAQDAKTAQTFFEVGYDYARKGNYAVAVEMYRKGIEHAPGNQMGHYFLADALEQLGGHRDEAIAEYTLARDLDATSERGVMAAARILALQQVPAALPQQKEFRDCESCPDMVAIPAGTFQMGSPPEEPGYLAYDGPVHTVQIAKPFAAGKFEVTRGQFRRFVDETGRIMGSCSYWDGKQEVNSPTESWNRVWFEQDDIHPVVCVNWEDAKAYAEWLSRKTGKAYRLLTEAEWEYAARAGSWTSRYWGDDPSQACQYANVADLDAKAKQGWTMEGHQCHDGWVGTAPVGRYRANAFGLYDMLGNALEWVEDCWNSPDYRGAPADGSAWLTGDCNLHMTRGGGWPAVPSNSRSAKRTTGSSTVRDNTSGFRVARTLP